MARHKKNLLIANCHNPHCFNPIMPQPSSVLPAIRVRVGAAVTVNPNAFLPLMILGQLIQDGGVFQG